MEVEIEKLDYEGKGIARCDSKVLFIPRTLPGEFAKVKPVKENKNYSICILEELIKENEDRVPSYCPYSAKCGGCTYDIVSYPKSLEYKKESIKELLNKNGISLDEITIEPSIVPLHYRNKITLKVENHLVGYYQKESHTFIQVKNCELASMPIHQFIEDISLLNIQNGEVVIRSNSNDELLIEVISKEDPKMNSEIATKHKIAGIIWNKKCIYNSPFFFEKRNEILYKVRYSSFFQVNPYISEKIKEEIIKQFDSQDEVLDLYCGVGFFSIPLAKRVKSVIGIEYNPLAITDAVYNASLNNLNNLSFHAGKVEEIIDKIEESANRVIVDPPRAGLNTHVIEVLKKGNYDKIIYVSCNPFTLVRDLKELKDTYNIKEIKLYDMFAYTSHCESITILERR